MNFDELSNDEKTVFNKLTNIASSIDKKLDDYLDDYRGTNKSLMKLIQVICCIESVTPLFDATCKSPFENINNAVHTLLMMIFEDQYEEVKKIFNKTTADKCIIDAPSFDPLITTQDFKEIISTV